MTTEAVEALHTIHGEMRSVFESLPAQAWGEPSRCEGWRVQDVLAHVTSNMKEMVEPSPAPAGDPPAMKAEAAVEAMVAPRKGWTPQQLLSEYDQYRDGWLAALGAMQEEPVASTESPLADLGTHPLHLIANAFAFDHYCHLRIDLADHAGDLPVATHAAVRPGIDWMIAGMAQMQPQELKAAVSAPLQLTLTGPGAGSWTIKPAGDGPMIQVVETDGPDPAAVITSSAHDFVSWGTKRSDWRGYCDVSGDAPAAESFLDTLNII